MIVPPQVVITAPVPFPPRQAPPIIMVEPSRTSDVVVFTPGVVECDGQPAMRGGVVPPFTTVVERYGRSPEPLANAVYRFTFAIDASGRPRTIRRDEKGRSADYYLDTSDLAPSLAVSRFPAGAVREHCSIAYVITAMPVASAPLSTLYELASGPDAGTRGSAVYARLTPPDADCAHGPGPFRQLNQPAFERIAQAPGTWLWTYLSFDVDPGGKPANVRVLGSAGNRALDAAGVSALAANRYAPGPGYRGCSFHFYRFGPGDDQRVELPADTPVDTGELPACAIDPATMRSLLDGTAYPARSRVAASRGSRRSASIPRPGARSAI